MDIATELMINEEIRDREVRLIDDLSLILMEILRCAIGCWLRLPNMSSFLMRNYKQKARVERVLAKCLSKRIS